MAITRTVITELRKYLTLDFKHVPHGDSSLEEINLHLETLQHLVQQFNTDPNKPNPLRTNTIKIFPKELEYLDLRAAEARLINEQSNNNKDPSNTPITNEEVTQTARAAGKVNYAYSHHYGAGSASNPTTNFYVALAHCPYGNFAQAKRDGWFVGLNLTTEEERALWDKREVAGHVVAIKIKNQVMTVYEPAYDPDGPPVYTEMGQKKRTGGIAGWVLVRDMINQIKKGKGQNIKEVRTGGGGNYDGQCREMSYRWLAQEMIREMDENALLGEQLIVSDNAWVEIKQG